MRDQQRLLLLYFKGIRGIKFVDTPFDIEPPLTTCHFDQREKSAPYSKHGALLKSGRFLSPFEMTTMMMARVVTIGRNSHHFGPAKS
jgi:hypothetical protein